MNKSIAKHLIEKIQNRLDESQQITKESKKNLRALGKVPEEFNHDKTSYIVCLRSLWSDHGEKDHQATNKDLNVAIREAVAGFMKTNHRKDVQANWTVWVEIDGSTYRYILPRKYYLAAANRVLKKNGEYQTLLQKEKRT
jgi:hypothetical protein